LKPERTSLVFSFVVALAPVPESQNRSHKYYSIRALNNFKTKVIQYQLSFCAAETPFTSSPPSIFLSIRLHVSSPCSRRSIYGKAIPAEGIKCINDLGDDVLKPSRSPEDTAESRAVADVAHLAIPSFTHDTSKALEAAPEAGCHSGAMPEKVDRLCARHILETIWYSTLFALETGLPHHRIRQVGRSLGQQEAGRSVVVTPKQGGSIESVLQLC
jgi:hypothetical protein